MQTRRQYIKVETNDEMATHNPEDCGQLGGAKVHLLPGYKGCHNEFLEYRRLFMRAGQVNAVYVFISEPLCVRLHHRTENTSPRLLQSFHTVKVLLSNVSSQCRMLEQRRFR